MPAALLSLRRRRRRRLQGHPLPPPLRQELPRLYRQQSQRSSQPHPSRQSLQTRTTVRRMERNRLWVTSERPPRLCLLSRTRTPTPRTIPPFNPTPSRPLRTRYPRLVLHKPALQTAPHLTVIQHRVPARDWALLFQHPRHRDTMPASEASPSLHPRRAALRRLG